MLFAPRRGDDTRRQLRSRSKEIAELGLQHADQLKRTAADLEQRGESYGRHAMAEATHTASRIRDVAQPVATSVGMLLLLNTGSREELMKVRGIGPVLADRIIRARPFTSTEQVAESGVLPAKILEELRRESKSA